MALTPTDPNAPDFTRRYLNCADARLGALALRASDDFFAAKERMLNPAPAQFIAGKYDANGKWMDGWESRRKRGPGHDWCIVRLARPTRIRGVDLDTSHFTGNFPPAASIDACSISEGDAGPESAWLELLPALPLAGNAHHYAEIRSESWTTHLRVNLHPDGGLARLRVYGTVQADAGNRDQDGLVDLAAALNGGRALAANNEHFGLASNLLLPGRGVDMGDGWETRRRREPGFDWCIIALAQPAIIEAIEVDTCHFKGNFPDRCSLDAALVEHGGESSIVSQSMFWAPLLAEQKLQMDHQHHFRQEIVSHRPISHVRLNIHPDGGVSRLRLRGRPA